MVGKTWVMALAMAIVSRLISSNGGPVAGYRQHHLHSRYDPEREIDMAYGLMESRRGDDLSARFDDTERSPSHDVQTDAAAGDVNGHQDQQPTFHYEVHRVQHKKFATTEQKLQAVIRQAAALASIDLHQSNDLEPEQRPQSRSLDSSLEHDSTSEQLDSRKEQRNKVNKIGEISDGLQQQKQQQQPESGVVSQQEELVHHQSSPDDQVNLSSHRIRPPEQTDESVAEDFVEVNPVAMARGPYNVREISSPSSVADIYFLAVVAGCSVAGVAGLLFAGICWYRLHKKMKAASDVDYPAYGVTGPVMTSSGKDVRGSGPPGDRKLAQSAQMYHYQHQKQQMIASERLSNEMNQQQLGAGSDVESEEENEEGDYTVFECPGLATAGEMEVRNPLFNNDQTPVATPADVTSSASRK